MVRALLFLFIFLASFSQMGQAQENSPLKLVFFNAPPFSWEKDGEVHGLAVDLLTEVLIHQMKLKVAFDIFPWERAQMLVKEGIHDGFLNRPTEKRKVYAEPSQEALLTLDFILFANIKSPHWPALQKVRHISELKRFLMCQVQGTSAIRETQKNDNIYSVTKPKHAFLMVSENRCDVFVAPQLVGQSSVKKLGLKSSVAGIPEAKMASIPYHLMIAKQSHFRDILPQFDHVLKKLKSQKTLELIHQKYVREVMAQSH